MNPDRMLYIVVSAHRAGDFIPERNLSDMDRRTTVRDIRAGQFGDISHVIEFNIAEHIVADVTEDVLREAGDGEPPPLTGQDLIDWRHDHERALRKEAGDGHDH